MATVMSPNTQPIFGKRRAHDGLEHEHKRVRLDKLLSKLSLEQDEPPAKKPFKIEPDNIDINPLLDFSNEDARPKTTIDTYISERLMASMRQKAQEGLAVGRWYVPAGIVILHFQRWVRRLFNAFIKRTSSTTHLKANQQHQDMSLEQGQDALLKEESEIRIDASDNNSSEEGDDVMDDSSEEEDDDNDEEAMQKVREGFIVDDDEDDEISRKKRRKHKRKREKERSQDEPNDALDEDDLELLRENAGEAPSKPSQNKFKRLKRAAGEEDGVEDGLAEDSTAAKPRDRLTDFFSDDEEDDVGEAVGGEEDVRGRDEGNILDEFEDFIEEDEYSDEEEAKAHKLQQQRTGKEKGSEVGHTEALEHYDWALEAQDLEDEGNNEQEPTALDEVFEHSELKDRMLTEEDNLIRIIDVPRDFRNIEYHTLYEKRVNTEKLINELSLDDDLVKDIQSADSMVAVQDLQDYINFTYSAEIKKLNDSKEQEQDGQEDEDRKSGKKHSRYAIFERIRENVLYDAVKGYGISAKEFGENVQDQSLKNYEVPYRIHATDDSNETPEDMIERLVEDDEILFKDPKNALSAVRKICRRDLSQPQDKI
ncbi:transcription elongation factor SPT6 [Candidozyma auris]|nr:transcription elongation factor SPT6 [[Candida] auris]